MGTQQMTGSPATVAGAELHFETRGAGPPILLIPGVPGDGSQFDALAEKLAADHLVVTYDRRGYARSPRPSGWATTSVAEQAADAAALIEISGAGPATVFGTSNGALFALELGLSRPDLIAGLILHEPPLLSVLAEPDRAATAIRELLEPAFAAGGPDAALEAFLRFAWGDAVVDRLEPGRRARMLADGEVAMAIEMPATSTYRPDETKLSALTVPAQLLVGRDQHGPLFHEASAWLSRALGVAVTPSPGAHAPHLDHPHELADLLRRFAGRAA